MAVRCVYCGGSHRKADDVRACWSRHEEGAPPVDDPVSPAPPGSPALPVSPVPGVPPLPPVSRSAPAAAPSWAALAGPEELGRNVVVLAGAAAPPPWEACPRIVIDESVVREPTSAAAELRRRWLARERTVVELRVEFDRPPDQVERRPPHELGPRFVLELDALHHLVWANSVDGRWEGSRRWPWSAAACELGAARGGESSDVVLPDGRRVWIDGGALAWRPPIVDVGVLHRIALEHGSLEPFGPGEPVADLAPDQLAAVRHEGGAARIIAPAGSGKTRVLTARARHLVQGWRIPAPAIGLVAFNKRAQEEMRERTADVRSLSVRTLNAIALAIVNGTAPFAPRPRRFATITEPEVRRILGSLVTLPRRRNTDPLATWIEALGAARLGLVPPERVEARYDGDVDGFADVLPKYRQALDRLGSLDFDEQVQRAIEVLLTDPVARRAAQRACRVLLVDEFQDLTPAHVLLVRLLAGPDLAVFGVGDDDQTIYGYNGADPAWLIEFADLFPGAGDHPLEVNYRCPGGVVEVADRLLRHNRRRVPKTIRAASPLAPGWTAASVADPVAQTVEAVSAALRAERSPSAVAVLTRVNSVLAPVQVALDIAGVPRSGGVGGEFVERSAVRSALAWIRLATSGDRWDRADVAEALRRPSRPLHPSVATWVTEQADAAGLQRLAGRVREERDSERIQAFAADIERVSRLAARGASTADVLREVRDRVGLGGAVATLDGMRRGMNRAAQSDDLDALVQLGELHPDPVGFDTWLTAALSRRGEPGGVTLSTVHRVKGQEWPVVVVHGAEAEQFPHRLADDIEEERRLFHVAITRAIDHVVLVSGARPSPFISELTTEPPPPGANPLLTDRERRDQRRGAPDTPGGGSAPRSTRKAAGTDAVIAVPGLVLVDQGASWTVESVDASGALARNGGAVRRFVPGAKAVTAGGRRGPLDVTPMASELPVEELRHRVAAVLAEDRLRGLRATLAAGRPAYVVFDDATIARIATAMPTTIAELATVAGIGPRKLELYGDAVIVAIEDSLDAGGAGGSPPA